jgi:hypothetical protein
MARPPRQYTGSLTPGQASYVMERLIAERAVSANDIERYVSEMSREISTLEARLQRLRDAAGPAAAAAAAGIAAGVAGAAAIVRRRRGRPGRPPGRKAAAAAPSAPAKKRGRKRASITPEQLASRQLQGRYLALVRQFPPTRRAHYAKVAKEKGREAAIKEMQDARK